MRLVNPCNTLQWPSQRNPYPCPSPITPTHPQTYTRVPLPIACSHAGRARAAAIAPSDPSAPPLPPPPGWVRVSGGEGEELEPTLAEEDLLGEEAAEEVDEEEWV